MAGFFLFSFSPFFEFSVKHNYFSSKLSIVTIFVSKK